MQLGCIKNSTLIGYEAYEEVGILHCWRTIEAAWFTVSDEFYIVLYTCINSNFSTLSNLTMTLKDNTTKPINSISRCKIKYKDNQIYIVLLSWMSMLLHCY